MNSTVGPNFKVVFAEKVHAGPVNSARDPLKTLNTETFSFQRSAYPNVHEKSLPETHVKRRRKKGQRLKEKKKKST